MLVLLGGLATLGCGQDGGSPSTPAATDTTAAAPVIPSAEKRPILLMFHSGGFLFGSPDSLAEAEEVAEDHGFAPVPIAYPLGDLSAAVGAARDAAGSTGRGGRAIFAYGESAGGTLAALLAAEGRVKAAATYSQLTDIPVFFDDLDPGAQAFIGATDRQLREFSPASRQGLAPVFAMVPVNDDALQNRATERWDRREARVHAVSVPGGHLGRDAPGVYRSNMERALRWLSRRAAAPAPG